MNHKAIPEFHSNDERVTIGNFTYGNPKLMLWSNTDRIEIGAYCSIAENVTIFGGGEHNSNWVTTYPLRIAFGDSLAWQDGHPTSKGKTIIGNDVWIGFGATILSGVKIGDGAIIGSGAIITKNLPPYCISAGNPARIIRYRFSESQVNDLIAIKWWNWSEEKIKKYLHLLCSENIDQLITISKEIGAEAGK